MSGKDIFKNPSEPILFENFLYQNGLNLAIGIGAIIVFCILRPSNGAVYHRRRKLLDPSKRFNKIGNGLFDWIGPVWHCSEKEVLEKCGLDAVMFLRFIKLGLQYGLSMLIFGIGLVIVNYFNPFDPNSVVSGKGFDLQRLSISAGTDNNFLWVHIGCGWISSFILLILIYKNNLYFIKMRQDYFNSNLYKNELSSRTLILTQLPEILQSEDNLKTFVDNLDLRFKYLNVSVARKVAHLPELTYNYNSSVRLLESIVTKYVNKDGTIKGNRPTLHLGKLSFLNQGEKVDSIDYHIKRILEIYNEIHELRGYANNLPPSSIGFVSFKDSFSAHVCMQQLEPGLHSKLVYKNDTPIFSLAPHPNDLLWMNIKQSKKEIAFRNLIFTTIFIIILIVGAFPLTIISTMSNVATLRTLFGDPNLFTNSTLKSLIEGTLAPLIMILSMLLIQVILRKLSFYQSAKTQTLVDRRLFSKYYTFLLFNHLVIFSALQALGPAKKAFDSIDVQGASSFIKSLQMVIPEIGRPFALAILKASSFWVNQISLRTLSYILELVQVVSLLRRMFQKYFLRHSPRELKEYSLPQSFEYPIVYAIQCFYFTLNLVFGISAPLIIPFSIFNFFVSYFVYKHQLMYVYKTEIESGGRAYKTAIDRVISALILSQFFLLLMLVLKVCSNQQWIVILPLPFITIVAFLSHQSWLESKLEYIDWKQPNYFKSDSKSNNQQQTIDFDTQFYHPAFSQQLLNLEVDPIVLSAVPELNQLGSIVITKNFNDFTFSPESQHSLVQSNQPCSPSNESDSVIELLDRNSQPKKVMEF